MNRPQAIIEMVVNGNRVVGDLFPHEGDYAYYDGDNEQPFRYVDSEGDEPLKFMWECETWELYRGAKCIVKGCSNHKLQGTFIDNMCAPCYTMITTGVVSYSNNFIAEMHDKLNGYNEN